MKFLDFVYAVWPTTHPHPFVNAPHIEAFASLVDRIASGESVKAILVLNERRSKSVLASLMAPAYLAALDQQKTVGITTNRSELTSYFVRRGREILMTDEARDVCGRIGIERGNRVDDIAFFAGGKVLGNHIGGPLAGHSFDVVFVDDPLTGEYLLQRAGHDEDKRAELCLETTKAVEHVMITKLKPGGSSILVTSRACDGDVVDCLKAAGHDFEVYDYTAPIGK